MIFEKLKGGCLVVEGAGDLDDKAAGIIADFVQQENQDVAIVLEGEEESIKTAVQKVSSTSQQVPEYYSYRQVQ